MIRRRNRELGPTLPEPPRAAARPWDVPVEIEGPVDPPGDALMAYLAAGRPLPESAAMPQGAASDQLTAAPPLPTAHEAAVALNKCHDAVVAGLGSMGPAVLAMLAGLHHSLTGLIPDYPAALARPALHGFSVRPARSLDELDALLNRVEGVLLQLLPRGVGGNP